MGQKAEYEHLVLVQDSIDGHVVDGLLCVLVVHAGVQHNPRVVQVMAHEVAGQMYFDLQRGVLASVNVHPVGMEDEVELGAAFEAQGGEV